MIMHSHTKNQVNISNHSNKVVTTKYLAKFQSPRAITWPKIIGPERNVNLICNFSLKKSLNIPKGLSEAVSRRRIDNKMSKRKRTRRQKQWSTMHYTENSCLINMNTTKNCELECSEWVSSSCSYLVIPPLAEWWVYWINHPWNQYNMRMLTSWSTKIPNMNKIQQKTND
jgi:hypothetical protein